MTGPRGEYSKSALRRGQILDAATAIFTKGGYTASSVNEIARAVGMTQTGVLHHFNGGKVALLRAVLEQRDARAEGVLEGRHGRQFLRGLIEISRSQEQQRGAVQLYTILSAEATDADHPAHDYFAQRFTRITDAVTGALQEVEAEDGLRPGVEPRRAAIELVALVEGLELLWLNGLDVNMADDVRYRLNHMLITPLQT
ncbi:AcrR family transcriptional regulator [Okibacterium sp. HSC-33S16]|uniref:TetR/AcrR family transcriptional regulator n=1 Tax=Okibacterium sp. HSC-33S16 TaxID=2910965 RepID=UPI00209EAA0F|nr:TetR/AcrR family transcriptional regulator [Okibacterium sp. HSC-33S16]MCP2031092.1 AcrR family transcriptional regulator [Okibacterium sp. HSC-33S16]